MKIKTRVHRRIMIAFDNLDFEERWLQRIVCFFSGHTPEMEHCGMPEHDHCFWCGKSMPNKARNRR